MCLRTESWGMGKKRVCSKARKNIGRKGGKEGEKDRGKGKGVNEKKEWRKRGREKEKKKLHDLLAFKKLFLCLTINFHHIVALVILTLWLNWSACHFSSTLKWFLFHYSSSFSSLSGMPGNIQETFPKSPDLSLSCPLLLSLCLYHLLCTFLA